MYFGGHTISANCGESINNDFVSSQLFLIRKEGWWDQPIWTGKFPTVRYTVCQFFYGSQFVSQVFQLSRSLSILMLQEMP